MWQMLNGKRPSQVLNMLFLLVIAQAPLTSIFLQELMHESSADASNYCKYDDALGTWPANDTSHDALGRAIAADMGDVERS